MRQLPLSEFRFCGVAVLQSLSEANFRMVEKIFRAAKGDFPGVLND